VKARTKATLDGLALQLSRHIYDLTIPRALTINEQNKRLDALEHALKLTLEVTREARLEMQPLLEESHVQVAQS